jgi:hypothetical protein
MKDSIARATSRRGLFQGSGGAAALALAAMLGILAGCGNQSGDFNTVAPVGQAGNALLFLDITPADPDTNTVQVHAIVFDNTPADGFRAYIDPDNQGYRPATNFIAPPTLSLNTGWQYFDLVLDGFDPAKANRVVARGARNGIESSAAVLTPTAFVPAADPKTLARRAVFSGLPFDSTATDTIPTLSWDAVPGAQDYFLQIQGRGGLQYAAVVQGTSHKVRIGPGLILQDVPMRPNFLYRWSVVAIGADGRTVAVIDTLRALLTVRSQP